MAWAYRNGPIEDLHAGRGSRGTALPGYKRLYADELDRIARTTATKLAQHLLARDRLGGPYLRAGVRLLALGAATGWSLTAETAPVDYPGLPGAEPLNDRLRHLAVRWPAVYGTIVNRAAP